MSKTLICIQSYGAARDTVWRHWPLYKKAGCDILGVNTFDRPHDWPEECPTVNIGRDSYLDGTDFLCRRLLETIAYVLREPRYQAHTHFMFVEHDAVFIRPIPEAIPGLTTPYPGFNPKEWGLNSEWFIHTPYWADRETCERIVKTGYSLLQRGINDKGNPDSFIGSIIADGKLPWQHLKHFQTFSVNSGSLSEEAHKDNLRKSIIEHIAHGCWYVHGLKTTEEFLFIHSHLP